MDYQQLLQRHIAKITIGFAVVGATTFTVWYYNSHKTEQEPYIEQVPSISSSLLYPKSINKTNTQESNFAQTTAPIDTYQKNNNNKDSVSKNANDPSNKLSENEPSQQITVSSTHKIDAKPTENKQDETDEKLSNDTNIQNKASVTEQVIGNTETDNENKNEKQCNEIYKMSDESETSHFSDYKAKFNSKPPHKIQINGSDEHTKKEILEIHARSEQVSKQKRKVGRLNKDSFKFGNDNDSTRPRGTSTPRKALKDDNSWVKLKPKRTSGHAEHPSVMALNVSKLVTDAQIINALTPISDQKASSMSMKSERKSGNSNRSSQKQ